MSSKGNVYYGPLEKGYFSVYNLNFIKGTHPIDVELLMFKEKMAGRIPKNFGGKPITHHFKQVAKALWPEEDGVDKVTGRKIVHPVKFIWHAWADRMLEAACNNNYLGIAGCSGLGKCLHPDTPVLFYDGSIRPAKEVKIGDQLMGDDSTPRNVLMANPGRSNMVRIVPNDGEPWICNDDHMLTLKRAWAQKKAAKRKGEVIDISVKDYLASAPTFQKRMKLFCVGVEFPEQPVEFDPRIYGIWLGDGSTSVAAVTSPDSETQINDYMTSYFEKNGYVVKKEYYGKSCPCWMFSYPGTRKNPFLHFVRRSSGWIDATTPCEKPEKRILPEYLYNSRKVRMELLAGLLDTDGHTNGTSFEIACSYDQMAEDIVFLARSLGFRVSKKLRYATCNGKKFKTHRIWIRGNVSEIPTFRKIPKSVIRTDATCSSFKIEQLGEGDWYGFTLDGNGRFLLGDFTVTHNTELFSIWVIINFLCDPANTLCIVTSVTIGTSKKKMWGKIVQYWTPCEKLGFPGKLVDSSSVIRYVDKDRVAVKGDMAGISLIAGEKKKEKEAVGKLIGMHQERIIFCADELGELSEAVPEAAFNNLNRGCRYFQFIGINNPASFFDPFGKFTKPKAGWESITVEDDEWETERGICLHFDTLKNPRITHNDTRLVWMDTQEDIDREIAIHGGKSASFWRMFRGFWCPTGVIEQIYTEVEIIGCKAQDKAVWLDNNLTHVSFLDPSFTNGGDRTVAYFGTLGTNMEGYKTLQYDCFYVFQEDVTNKTITRSQQCIGWWRDLCTKHNVSPRHAGYDATGGGGPFGEMVSIMFSRECYGMNFGTKASDKPCSAYDPTPCHDRYVNRVTEIWYSCKEPMRNGQIKGLSDEMIAEMCLRKKTDEKGIHLRIRAQSKKEMKLDVGNSPDIADAGLGLSELCRERLGFDSGSVTKKLHNTGGEKKKGISIFKKLNSIYGKSTMDRAA